MSDLICFSMNAPWRPSENPSIVDMCRKQSFFCIAVHEIKTGKTKMQINKIVTNGLQYITGGIAQALRFQLNTCSTQKYNVKGKD